MEEKKVLTKEEILKEIEVSKSRTTTVSMAYRFDEGNNIILKPPKTLLGLKNRFGEVLASRSTEPNLELASLLYYYVLMDLPAETAKKVTGKVSLDENLFTEQTKETAKTGATAAFSPLEEKISITPHIFTGHPVDKLEHMITLLHETRHYYQHLTTASYQKSLDGTQKGELSEEELVAMAFREFGGNKIFPQATKEQLAEMGYALYHQSPREIDAREYSFEESIRILESALQATDENNPCRSHLELAVPYVKKQKAKNDQENQIQQEKYLEIKEEVIKVCEEIQSRRFEILTPENIAKLEHYDEWDDETESLRQYIFDLERSLLVKFDKQIAELIQEIVLKYDVFAVGKTLAKNPNFKMKSEALDKLIKRDSFIHFGMCSLCPIYDIKEVTERYAELNAGQPGKNK